MSSSAHGASPKGLRHACLHEKRILAMKNIYSRSKTYAVFMKIYTRGCDDSRCCHSRWESRLRNDLMAACRATALAFMGACSWYLRIDLR